MNYPLKVFGLMFIVPEDLYLIGISHYENEDEIKIRFCRLAQNVYFSF
jgi:hypothetical protein